MTSTFEVIKTVRETAKAWVECGCVNIDTQSYVDHEREACSCNGDGGKWNRLIIQPRPDFKGWKGHVGEQFIHFGKATILTREWGLCLRCNGTKIEGSCLCNRKPCSHCHQDADGNPTGAEPGSAGDWKVSR